MEISVTTTWATQKLQLQSCNSWVSLILIWMNAVCVWNKYCFFPFNYHLTYIVLIIVNKIYLLYVIGYQRVDHKRYFFPLRFWGQKKSSSHINSYPLNLRSGSLETFAGHTHCCQSSCSSIWHGWQPTTQLLQLPLDPSSISEPGTWLALR